jgi:hypothetical protein
MKANSMNKSFKIGSGLFVMLLRLMFALALIYFAVTIYKIFLNDIISGDFIIPITLCWLFTAYIVLPRVHRTLTKLYIPDYYIGRTRSPDGFYGDPINLAFFATKSQIVSAMKGSGWVEAEPLKPRSIMKMIYSTVLKKSYPNAPVSSLYLFSKKQDLVFQQELNGNPHARHHIRFWEVPKHWKLPGGHEAQWLAAATFDRRVGISFFTLQMTHRIEEMIDIERDYIIKTLKDFNKIESIEVIKDFSVAYHSRNGGGDAIQTDGSMPFISLK